MSVKPVTILANKKAPFVSERRFAFAFYSQLSIPSLRIQPELLQKKIAAVREIYLSIMISYSAGPRTESCKLPRLISKSNSVLKRK